MYVFNTNNIINYLFQETSMGTLRVPVHLQMHLIVIIVDYQFG